MRKTEEEQAINDQSPSPKETLILDCALKLLIETGDAGLTLRKIADCAGMRLSNVQYYFKSRDDILTAMVGRYFEDCTASLVRLTQESEVRTTRERVHFLVLSGLSHGLEISDMCRAFREIWAISSRNAVIDACLMAYYRTFSDVMIDFAFQQDIDEASRDKLKSLLVPFFEGYSITARSLPLQIEETAAMLTDLAMSVAGDRA
ncbi:TetR/AcrR family transcriptional regulator [Roseovarius sp. CAU 1744]|uniref:TetR/AcrR family transcriptional regulator n=1 Tax=Roseovarius sp. CAU 1744 TaxID=3140368 RepID=UPI00325C0707